MIDLLKIWKEELLKEQRVLQPKQPKHFSDSMMQSSFDLPDNTKVMWQAFSGQKIKRHSSSPHNH